MCVCKNKNIVKLLIRDQILLVNVAHPETTISHDLYSSLTYSCQEMAKITDVL